MSLPARPTPESRTRWQPARAIARATTYVRAFAARLRPCRLLPFRLDAYRPRRADYRTLDLPAQLRNSLGPCNELREGKAECSFRRHARRVSERVVLAVEGEVWVVERIRAHDVATFAAE